MLSVEHLRFFFQIQRGVIVIPKSTNNLRIEENIGLFDFCLDEGEMEEINAINLDMRLIVPVLNGRTMEAYPHYPFKIDF